MDMFRTKKLCTLRCSLSFIGTPPKENASSGLMNLLGSFLLRLLNHILRTGTSNGISSVTDIMYIVRVGAAVAMPLNHGVVKVQLLEPRKERGRQKYTCLVRAVH